MEKATVGSGFAAPAQLTLDRLTQELAEIDPTPAPTPTPTPDSDVITKVEKDAQDAKDAWNNPEFKDLAKEQEKDKESPASSKSLKGRTVRYTTEQMGTVDPRDVPLIKKALKEIPWSTSMHLTYQPLDYRCISVRTLTPSHLKHLVHRGYGREFDWFELP